MPPASNVPPREKEQLQRKFSAAATALAELYRESSNAYEAGYRDALLFVQRYLQGSPRLTDRGLAPSSAFSACETVNAQHMAQFLQNTLTSRRERMAAVRGLHSLRRRRRDSLVGDADLAEDDDGDSDTTEHDGEGELVGEGRVEQVGAGSGRVLHICPPTAEGIEESRATATPPELLRSAVPSPAAVPGVAVPLLVHEQEQVPQLAHRASARLPYQPRRQRPRMERLHGHRSLSASSGHPFSTQLRVDRRS